MQPLADRACDATISPMKTQNSLKQKIRFQTHTTLDYIDQLRAFIEQSHDCSARFTHTETVQVTAESKTLWYGDVHVFALSAHPTANACYAWRQSPQNGASDHFVTVLELPPVIDGHTAVQVWIANHQKKGNA